MKPENTAPVIEVENLSFRFDGGPPVLEGVNLEIAAGDFASVIGPNGGGKTTLVKLIVGLLTPPTGWVRIVGLPPSTARPRSSIRTASAGISHNITSGQFPSKVSSYCPSRFSR